MVRSRPDGARLRRSTRCPTVPLLTVAAALLPGVALAHLPHDNVRAFAAGGGAWWLLADPSGTSLLLRSDDGGATFSMVGGPPVADRPKAVASLDDGTLVLLGHTRYWWTSDDAQAWQSAPLPGNVGMLSGGEALILAGDGGAWTGQPGDLAPGPSGSVVAITDGGVLVYGDGSTTTVDGDGGIDGPGVSDVSAAVSIDDALYVGTGSGSVWRHAGAAWTRCGALPPDTAGESGHPDIVSMAHDGGTLLVATGWRAPFVSDDGCATWADRHTPHDVSYDSTGGAEAVSDAYPVLAVPDGRWIVAGWMGSWWSADQGATWTEAPVIPPDYTRGLAYAGDFATSARVWIGTYSAGPAATADGGETYTCPAHGLGDSNVQALVQAHDPRQSATLYGIIGWQPEASRDGGTSWARLEPGTTDVSLIATFDDSNEVWVFGDDGSGVQEKLRSGDGGMTWGAIPGLAEALGDTNAGPVGGFTTASGAEARCVTRHEAYGVVCTMDGGGSWTLGAINAGSSGDGGPTGASPTEDGTAVVGWPSGAATRVIWTDNRGVHVSDDWGVTVRDLAPSGALDTPLTFTGADDGSLYFATRAGAVWRSLDGGDTWEDLGVYTPAWVHVLAPSPGFAAHPQLLLGTHDGIFYLDDATGPAPTLHRWARWERVDGTSGYVACVSCPMPPDDPTTAMDALLQVPAGAVAEAWLRGTRVRVLGQLADGGAAELWIDGVLAAEMVGGEGGDNSGAAADVAGLPEGWHRVEIVGTVGDGVGIDALEGYGDGDLLPLPSGATPTAADAACVSTVTPSDDTPKSCGCTSTPVGVQALSVAVAVLLATRRRPWVKGPRTG